ncbi:MAG: hypothetical protein HQM04_07200 [Magnetococcales bacterium]|nr:hypothetical protein [Magnetococcales bacterium]MBF0114816.1 hypothetical protein [Magnetococcales bacterium]
MLQVDNSPYALKLLHDWQEPERYFACHASPHSMRLRAALCCLDSLTLHLQQSAKIPIQVRIEKQYRLPNGSAGSNVWWSGQRLLPVSMPILSRTAWLLQEDRELILAYSELSLQNLSDDLCTAIEEGEEPLGLLFHERSGVVERTDLQIAQANVPELALRNQEDLQTAYWCRRSIFQVNSQFRARIVELFLTGCCDEALD